MKRIARFEKVSRGQFEKDFLDTFGGGSEEACRAAWEQVAIPRRATAGSAGYDFITPVAIALAPGESVKVPTGIRAAMEGAGSYRFIPGAASVLNIGSS